MSSRNNDSVQRAAGAGAKVGLGEPSLPTSLYFGDAAVSPFTRARCHPFVLVSYPIREAKHARVASSDAGLVSTNRASVPMNVMFEERSRQHEHVVVGESAPDKQRL